MFILLTHMNQKADRSTSMSTFEHVHILTCTWTYTQRLPQLRACRFLGHDEKLACPIHSPRAAGALPL